MAVPPPLELISKAVSTDVERARLVDARQSPQPASARNIVDLVALVHIDKDWLVGLRQPSSGEIAFLKKGESRYEYLIKDVRIEESSVVVEHDGHELIISMGGREMPHRAPDSMSSVTTRRWVEQWHNHVNSLPSGEQQTARQDVRQYWRKQWDAGLAEAVQKLPLEEQIRLRAEISRSWRE